MMGRIPELCSLLEIYVESVETTLTPTNNNDVLELTKSRRNAHTVFYDHLG